MQFKDATSYDRQFRAAKRTCLNAMIQGFSAFVGKKALVEVDRDFRDEHLGAQVLYQVHDKVGALIAIEDAERAQEIMLARMRRFVDDVWLDADPEIKSTMSKGEKSKTIQELSSRGAITAATFKTDEELEEDDDGLIGLAEIDFDDLETPTIVSRGAWGVRTMTL